MKTLKTSLLSVFTCASIFTIGQVKIISPSNLNTNLNNTTITVSGTPSSSELDEILWLVRTDNVDRSIKCRKTEVDVLAGTKNITCWNICPINYDNAGDFPINTVGVNGNHFTEELPHAVDGDTIKSFAAHYKPEQLDGCSLFKFEWYNANHSSETYATIFIRYTHNVSTSCTASLNETQDVNFSLYPNPANESLTIDLESIEQYDISIIDLLGKTILTNINLVNSNLNVSNLNDGVYFVSISKQGRLIKSEKLLIKH